MKGRHVVGVWSGGPKYKIGVFALASSCVPPPIRGLGEVGRFPIDMDGPGQPCSVSIYVVEAASAASNRPLLAALSFISPISRAMATSAPSPD